MRRALLLSLTLCLALGGWVARPAQVAAQDTPIVPAFGHIFVIMMENMAYGDIIGSGAAPYINQLARTYALAARYYGVTHPSLPNYLALTSGSTQGQTTDCPTCSYNVPNLADQIEAHGKTWHAYIEGLPFPCYNGPTGAGLFSGLGLTGYARKHNPWMYYDDISQNPARCQQVVPLTQLATDLQQGQVADFVWITPNLQHSMHGGNIHEGDRWLAGVVPGILASPAWREGGVLFIIWDEGKGNASCCGNAAGGHTLALAIAPNSRPGFRSQVAYSHYSVLRTIEQAWGLELLGEAGAPGTQPMADLFTAPAH